MPFPWAVAIPAIASIAGGIMGSQASKDAAGAQQQSTREAIAENARQFDLTRSDTAPYREGGLSSYYTLLDMLGIPRTTATQRPAMPSQAQFTSTIPGVRTAMGRDPQEMGGGVRYGTGPSSTKFDQAGYESAIEEYNRQLQAFNQPQQTSGMGSLMQDFTGKDLQNEPGYQFGLSQGNLAINRGASAHGMRQSPATIKSLLRYGQDYAGTKYGEAFNRDAANKQRKFNFLATPAGIGQATTMQVGQMGAANSRAIGDLLTQGGNAQAAGIVGGYNSISGGINNALNYWQQQQMLDQMRNQGSSPNYYGL